MNEIRHQEISRDSLYKDLTENLETIVNLWKEGNRGIRFILPVLCAIRLEAFINVVGKLHVKSWDNLERKLGFKEKCLMISEVMKKEFDVNDELNKKVISIFETRNSIVHPKMKLQKVDEMISKQEYEKRQTGYLGVDHHLRSELTQDEIQNILQRTDEFIEKWGKEFLDYPEYWLSKGSTGSFGHEPN